MYLVMVHTMMNGDDCDDSEDECHDDDYSWLPFEQGRFRAETAERAQVQIARVTTPEFHYYNEI